MTGGLLAVIGDPGRAAGARAHGPRAGASTSRCSTACSALMTVPLDARAGGRPRARRADGHLRLLQRLPLPRRPRPGGGRAGAEVLGGAVPRRWACAELRRPAVGDRTPGGTRRSTRSRAIVRRPRPRRVAARAGRRSTCCVEPVLDPAEALADGGRRARWTSRAGGGRCARWRRRCACATRPPRCRRRPPRPGRAHRRGPGARPGYDARRDRRAARRAASRRRERASASSRELRRRRRAGRSRSTCPARRSTRSAAR